MSENAAIRRFLDEQHGYGARYLAALARRLDLDAHEATAVLHLALAGRLATKQLSRALVLPTRDTTALIEGLLARGYLVRSGPAADEFGLAPAALEQLDAVTRPLSRDLDAVAARLSAHEREIVGRFLQAIVDVSERHADDAARRALESAD